MNMQPSPLDQLRDAEAALALAKQTAPLEQAQAMASQAIIPHGPWTPLHDVAAQVIAEAEIKVAAAQTAYAEADPEAAQIREALRSALSSAIEQLEALADPKEPTIAGTPEAAKLYSEELEQYRSMLDQNSRQRSGIDAAACVQLGKASSLADAKAVIARAESDTAAVVDPAEPVLGHMCPTNIEALERAINSRQQTVKSNQAARVDIGARLATMVRAIGSSFEALQARHKAEGLPMPRLWSSVMHGGHSISRTHLECGVYDLPTLRAHIDALGVAPVEAGRAKLALLEINARRKAYEARKATESKARKANPAEPVKTFVEGGRGRVGL